MSTQFLEACFLLDCQHLNLYLNWHQYILVQKICLACKNIRKHAKVWFYFNTYVLG